LRVGRIALDGAAHWAILSGDSARLLTTAPWLGGEETGAVTSCHRLLAPVTPSKIVAVGSNYPKHAAEMGKPIPLVPRLFLKPPSAIIGPNVAIEIPPGTERVDPEGELAVVIGASLSRATETECLAAVFGYTCLNDVTCRDFQRADGLFTRAKGFDTFCPIGPWIETELSADDLAVATEVSGTPRAAGRTSDMVFSTGRLLSFISSVMTLNPGDVVATGTPPGVAPIHHGDIVHVVIEGIGTLTNPVVNRSDRPL
jgi:2-keto-4-pentenoate hydratase/2-oxohepta-3-ene-1,7-dioic acid hydratase in catechol pathway